MVDSVNSIVLYEDPKHLVIKLMNRSDGTGESSIVKVDKSSYTVHSGAEPSFFLLDKILYDVSGMEALIWIDGTPDINLFRCVGQANFDFSEFGGISTRVQDGPGDIMITTNGHSAGDVYDITLFLRKKD